MEKWLKLIKECISELDFTFPYSAEEWFEKDMFVENYHKHTTWSNVKQIDSATAIEDYFKVNNQRHGTLYFSGEHGTQGNWVKCYDMCNDKKLEKKLGFDLPRFRYSTEAYWVKDRLKEYPTGIDKNGKQTFSKDRSNCHMILVARNYTGVRKLNYVLSIANVDGFFGKPRLDINLIKNNLTKDDVYITSSCIAGWKYEDAEEIWLDLAKHFGDSFFFEYQAHDTPEQKELNKKIQKLAKEHNIKTIIGLDTHVLDDEDNQKRDNLLKRKKIFYADESWWFLDYPTGKELFKRMRKQKVLSDKEILISMLNTHVFVNGCKEFVLDTDFKIPILPKYQHLSYEDRCKIMVDSIHKEYEIEKNQDKDRYDGMEYELNQIVESTTADYFIMNKEVIKEAVSDEFGGVLTKSSRGSASSFYTSYLCRFTNMDRFESEVPVFPERFITKDRILSSHQCPDKYL